MGRLIQSSDESVRLTLIAPGHELQLLRQVLPVSAVARHGVRGGRDEIINNSSDLNYCFDSRMQRIIFVFEEP